MNANSTPFAPTRIGLREITLLFVAAGFALLMLDVQRGAVITGWTVVALWLYGMIAGPRPTSVLTAAYGAGIFVTTFWWPRENWWHGAIALMWVSIGLIVAAGIMWLTTSWRRKSPKA